MAVPHWSIEVLRRGISDAARKASDPQTLAKLKTQATELLQEIPDTAARGIDTVMRSAESGKNAVQRWSRKHTTLAVPALNASGVLLGEGGMGLPVADQIVEIGCEFLHGDVLVNQDIDDRIAKRLAKRIPGGDQVDIAIASSFPAALSAFSSLVESTPLVIHRNHAVRLPNGLPLPEAFGTYLPVIQEVGAVGHVAATDFDGLDEFCAVLADGGSREVELLELPDREFLQAVVLPVGTVSQSCVDAIPSAEALISKGADFVILPGRGILGGPDCGLVVGSKEGIAQIKSAATWPSLSASAATTAMMTVALELAGDSSTNPCLGLIAASEENLRSRAERMATRLTGSDSIASCQVTADDARITPDGRWRFPSRQLRIRHANQSASDWTEKLQADYPAVMAVTDGDDLKIDLRWIAAADDGRLATALGSPKAEPESDA